MRKSDSPSITLFRVVVSSRPEDTAPDLEELLFEDWGGYFVCDGIVRYTLDKADACIVHDYCMGMAIAGPDSELETFKDGVFWTRDRKQAELAVALLKQGIARGLAIAKYRVGARLGRLIDED